MNTVANRKKMLYWALYDWAVTPYNTVIVTFIFSAYFIGQVAKTDIQGTALLGYANSIAAFSWWACAAGAAWIFAASSRSLWVFARCAISGVQAIAALTSLCLFAVIATPLADPHIKIPSSESFKDTSLATA